ncbi:hypothetical protein JL193_10995 [Polaribacter batillariae]|uniref:Uncharacterized protein n=1 Tax=Polaribacter batillariae TaxID=2808900 RepID=A0ABX7SR03_9FLAO|nr:hypothetical protein [Polaribacter batillariae]QTD36667.1 hypothetical protein JL193_10995 [Polaribacter batillariae]
MKRNPLNIFTSILLFCMLTSCLQKEANKVKIAPTYILSISAVENSKAPALQSFSHGISGDEWLLFAGRTNSENDNGGLHDIFNGNYANTSFLPPSFNDSLFVYNSKTNEKPISMHFKTVIEKMNEQCFEKIGEMTIPCIEMRGFLNEHLTIFRNSNALVKQDKDYLYVVGGYGAPVNNVNTQNYLTFNQVARINIPNMIKLIKGENLSLANLKSLISIGKNKNLISTGGELYIFDDTLYLAGGHNFTFTSQKYVDAVYPFTVSSSKKPYQLNINIKDTISDATSPSLKGTDATSIFRRRDGPITPNFYKVNNQIKKGLTFYTGVFRPDSTVIKNKDTTNYHLAWNNAIYVHPKKIVNSKKYTYDSNYNQNNFNVYSCPSFVLFDSESETLHTYLLGGIGDGKRAAVGHLSGFTNTGVHIKMNIANEPLKSSHTILDYNIFNNKTTNKAPFYGAEATLIPNSNLPKSNNSNEIIDLNKAFNDTDADSIEIGYIFGGIEAFRSNPGSYGPRNSRASNKIWKVMLKKQIQD